MGILDTDADVQMGIDHSMATAPGFAGFGLDPLLVEALVALGYEEPTPIQHEAIPPLLEGRDLLGQAATGTGKTAAFALPLLQRLSRSGEKGRRPAALILVPTRELAMQVAEAVHRYGRGLDVAVLPIYGGQPFAQQLRVLKRGVDVVIATPGRALDHINRGTLDLGGINLVVLDEADEMLDMGFAEDLEAILAATPADRQTVLFSATMPARIAAIARRHLKDPVQVRIAREQVAAGEVPRVRQTAYLVPRAHKLPALARVLDMESPDAAIIFCRTRNEVDELTEKLNAYGHRAQGIHGGLSQEQRERVMGRLKGGTTDLLVATDVAARGLDIPRLSHVINYDLPSSPESYVHRIGRVGRAGREGAAVTLIEPREHRLLRNIEQLTKQRIEVAKVPTVADLRARRLELVRASLREILLQGELDGFRVVAESLADEFGALEVAMAAVKMAESASGAEFEDQPDIPEVSLARESSRPAGDPAGDRKGHRAGARSTSPNRGEVGDVVRLRIGVGRADGVRPKDLVGAITGEAGVSGGDIGAIEIGDRFSVVEVAQGVVDDVLGALRHTKIRGKKVTVRR
jgi:ATP-dependent RNA helicase DeaD